MKRYLAVALILMLTLSSFSLTYGEEDEKIIVRPLVILMDYQDYSHEDFADFEEYPHQIGVTYADYSKALYQEMLFGDTTYEGPDGQTYITFKNYFNQLSHGTYITDGQVFGWYQASMNAAMYGGDQNNNGSDQDESKLLVEEALDFVALENTDLSQFDTQDPKDMDGDGITNEPDGVIDVVMIIHAGRGEEWGGGSLGSDAIWPFRIGFDWYADGQPYPVLDEDESLLANDFLIIEQDFPMGLAVHEYSHFLGLPDLYNYSGTSPVQTWSNMGGSYAGAIPGALPPNLGAYGRYLLKDDALSTAVSFSEIDKDFIGNMTLSASADTANEHTNLIRINLPQKETVVTEPTSGQYAYYSQTGNWLTQSMTTTLDLTGGTQASLAFKAWYDIDPEWDYASVQVKTENGDWTAIEGNITTSENPNDDTPEDPSDRNPGYGITNDSEGQWLDAAFDLTEYTGQVLQLKFFFWTDSNTPEIGIYIDDIEVVLDDVVILKDDGESDGTFTLEGFVRSTGKTIADHYYLLEYRDHQGVDVALTHTYYRHPQSAFNQGLVVWYIDETYTEDGDINQDPSAHPGHISVGVVDAGQEPVVWGANPQDRNIDYVRYQMHDAAFSLIPEPEYVLDWGSVKTWDDQLAFQPTFSDYKDYSSPATPQGGLILEAYGINIFILEENTEERTLEILFLDQAETQDLWIPVEEIFYRVEKIVMTLSEEIEGNLYGVTYGPKGEQALVTFEKQGNKYVAENHEPYELGALILESNGKAQALYNSQIFDYGLDFRNLPIRSSEEPDTVTYYVQAGDTLQKIAKKHHTTLPVLMTLNNIQNPNWIIPGQLIIVPSE